MISFAEWLPALAVGVSFTVMGCLKLFGFAKGVEGGHGKPLVARLCGT